jgi:hypothetical protein
MKYGHLRQVYVGCITCALSFFVTITTDKLMCKMSQLLQGVDIQAIIDDIRKLKIIVKGHERRIKSLEEQLAVYESHQHRDSY